jgi:DNA-binding MurR/RpiR family transcriptional regulator
MPASRPSTASTAEASTANSASISARLARTSLSPALGRVAELLLVDPESVAFGTVASVAERAGTSTPSVVRLATALGYEGFADLRRAARAELSVRLNTDAVRVRTEPAADPVQALLAVEQANLADTLGAVDPATLHEVVDLLADTDRGLWVLPSTQTAGVALRFADQLMIVRGGVTLLDGSEMRVLSLTRALRRGDVLVSMDVPRHELATVRIQGDAVHRGGVPVVLSGALPVGLSTRGGHLLPFACRAAGPFDSLVGLTALTTLLVNGVVDRRRGDSSRRIGDLERTWTTTGLFQA